MQHNHISTVESKSYVGLGVTDRQRDNLELVGFLVLHEPSPTATLNSSKVGVEGLLEVVKVTPVLVDGGCKLASWRVSSAVLLGCKVLPEESVVDMSSFRRGVSDHTDSRLETSFLPSVELQQSLKVDLGLHVVVLSCNGVLLLGLIKHVDIGLVVLGMMKLL